MYNRRLMAFLCMVGVCMAGAMGQLVRLQLVRGQEYAAEAKRIMRRSRLLATERGDIVDRHGRILATNEACFEFRMDYRALLVSRAGRQRGKLIADGLPPEQARMRVRKGLESAEQLTLMQRWLRRRAETPAGADGSSQVRAEQTVAERIEWTLDRAARIAGADRSEMDQTIDRVVHMVRRWRRACGRSVREESAPHAVIGQVDGPTAVLLRAELGSMVGASVAPSTRRWYPYDDLACHVIGLLGRVTADDVDNDLHADDARRRYLPDELAGIRGAEKLCEPILRGLRGRRTTGAAPEDVAPVLGRTVRLALDIELQAELTALLAATGHNGAIVVLDVPTGQVLALVSVPTFNLNTYKADLTTLTEDWSSRVNLPLLHRAVASRYPPGSTVKPVTALAAAAEGRITPGTTIECRGYLHVPTASRCWIYTQFGGAHGPLDLRSAIKRSCNIYFYTAAERVGFERLSHRMRQFGLGIRPGTGLPGEKAALVPTLDWLGEHRPRQRTFRVGDARQMGIGQGLLSATPLQVANVMATIGRNGVYLSPRLILDGGPEQVRRDLELPPTALQTVRDGMFDVVNAVGGTARRYAYDPSLSMCGKTGTATAWPLRVDTNIVKSGAMSWFAGYSPRRNARIAFAIVLEYVPKASGGRDCGPLAIELVKTCRAMGYVPQ